MHSVPPESDLSRTMRIDIPPDEAPPLPHPRRLALSTFVLRRHARPLRHTPYDLLLESVYDGVLVTNARGVILDFNQRAAEFFLQTGNRLLNRPVVHLISGADESLVASIWKNLETHRYTVVEARCVRSDGHTFPAEIAVNRLDIDDERLLCFFVRDISVRRKAQEDLEAALERMKAMDRMRAEFVSNVSHELRTPLTSMIYAVGNMLRGVAGPLPPKATQYIERLQSDCKRLLATVNDILDIRHIEDGSLTLSNTRLPLEPLVRASLETLAVQAENKGVALTAAFPGQELFAWCDARKIERVMINVIGNAIKFTDAGGAIHVAVGACSLHSGMTCVSVEDNGLGIPREALAKIAQRYFRVGQHVVGSGLGLSISREIMEMHGGRLDVESPPPGKPGGTIVYIHLPQTEPPSVVLHTRDEATAEQFLGLLDARGYRVARARGEEEVEAYALSQQADLFILDTRGLASPDLLLRLRGDPRCQRLPMLALAPAEDASGLFGEILRKIAVPVLRQPWEPAEFLRKVSSAFSGDLQPAPQPQPKQE
ncbi:MAG: PAS domain-containing sensor histidine kinase [Kiritimatiellaeota bacterium]|nr:PAS domain-containing sensor histidine kinase [Kiritimatiellota bacterium]